MTNPVITTATRSDESRIASVLTLAFASDPVLRWMYPDPLRYFMHFSEFVRHFGGRAFDAGSAYMVDGGSACALWLPPGTNPDGEALANFIERTVAGDCRAALFEMFKRMGGYRPDEPYWYLPLIGVDPARQGRGLGSVLLQHGLTKCDQDRRRAYLGSCNPRNITVYQRHGFELLGTVSVGTGPAMYPMVRRPR